MAKKKTTKKNSSNKKSSTKNTKQKTEETKSDSKKVEEKNNKIFKILFFICLIIIVLVFAIYFYIDSLRTYKYEGVQFETVQEGKLILYRTSIPVMHQGKPTPYNFYLRTNPRQLSKMDFNNSDFKLMKNSVLKFEDEFNCEGDGVIAIANLAKLHEILGINIIRDENATCDSRYSLYTLKEGDKTYIDKTEENCYDLYISDCEILKVTERIMLEMFVKFYDGMEK